LLDPRCATHAAWPKAEQCWVELEFRLSLTFASTL